MSTVTSPCIQVCRMDEVSGLCVGCWRTLDEIAIWGTATDEVRLNILAKLEKRRIDAATHRGHVRRDPVELNLEK